MGVGVEANVVDLSKKMYFTKRTVARANVMIWRKRDGRKGEEREREEGEERKGRGRRESKMEELEEQRREHILKHITELQTC